MGYGKKCNIIFIRKVTNRFNDLEERYKHLPKKEREGKINEELASFFCVDARQITNWKIAKRLSDDLKEINFLENLSPTILVQLNRLKTKDDQIEVANRAINEKLTVRQVKRLINEKLGKKPKEKIGKGLASAVVKCPNCKKDVPVPERIKKVTVDLSKVEMIDRLLLWLDTETLPSIEEVEEKPRLLALKDAILKWCGQ